MPKNLSVLPSLAKAINKRKGVIKKRQALTVVKNQRDWTAEEKDQVTSLETELDALNGRVSTLEDELSGDDDSSDDSSDDDSSDDSSDMSGSDRDDKGQRSQRRREAGRKKRSAKDGERRTERNSTSGGNYKKGETLWLPDGRKVVVVGEGRGKGGQRSARSRRTRTIETNRRASLDYRQGFARFVETGNMRQRNLQQDLDIQGGYLVAPVQLYERILKIVDNLLHIRALATTIQVVGAQSVGVPTLDADPSDADWTAEIGTVSEDSQMGFGRRELKPTTNTKAIRIAQKFLRNAIAKGFLSANADVAEKALSGIEDMIAKRFAYKFRVSQENAFINGTGVNQPLGMMVASTRGISTSRDIATGSATGLTYQGIINAKWTLRAGYAQQWLVSREFLKNTQGLVDSQNRPLYLDSPTVGMSATISGVPFMVSEYMPNVFTNGLYVGLLGDFSYYLIADGVDFMMKKLEELFAMNNQIGFIGYQELDGMPGMEDAFVRLKCST